MADAAERLVNLALYLAASTGTVTAEDIRSEVYGYPSGQDDPAFKRMLERDKDMLRSSGFAIESDEEGKYRLDRASTYIGPLSLSRDEAAAVTAAAVALFSDPSFPFSDELRLALAKIAPASVSHPDVAAVLADEAPERQGASVAALAEGVKGRKVTRFGYTNSTGVSSPHEVEPYGLFLHAGRWYLVGRDRALDEVRTYAVTRMDSIRVNASAPKTPDFMRPVNFDVSAFVRLPFQYGRARDEFEAVLKFSAIHARKARSLAARGRTSTQIDGSVLWHVSARSERELARFVVRNGPGLTVESPPAVTGALRVGLEAVRRRHA